MPNTPVELNRLADRINQFRAYLQALQAEYNDLQKEFAQIADKTKLKAVTRSLKAKK